VSFAGYLNYSIWRANVADADALRIFSRDSAQGIVLFKKSLSYSTPYKSEYQFDLVASIAGAVEKGLPLSSLLTASVFPKIVSQMVRVGEETGKIDEIFFKLADYFEEESDHLLKNLTVAIEPIVLIVLGIGVAFLVISIILPIYKLTTSF